jgi:hypothetical protein
MLEKFCVAGHRALLASPGKTAWVGTGISN